MAPFIESITKVLLTMNERSAKVAVVSRQDFERMKRVSAGTSIVLANYASTAINPKADKPTAAPENRKPLPKSVLLTEKDREIISRAEIAKQEELMEVRRANRIILTAKCNLIRNAQIAEKNELSREWGKEELRYSELMEKERQEELQRLAQENEEKNKLNKENADMIRKQLEHRANDRQKQAARITAEADYLALLEARLKASNDEATKGKVMRREQIKKDLQNAYEMNKRIKSTNFEKERMAELKVQEYMRQRKAREEALEAEKRRRNDQRERKLLKMCQDQMQTRNNQDQKYEKWFQRESESKEREFRQRELKAAVKRKTDFEAILEDRRMQQREKASYHRPAWSSKGQVAYYVFHFRNDCWNWSFCVRSRSTTRTCDCGRRAWKRSAGWTVRSRIRASTGH